jgi:hypothetical protein
MFKTLKEQIQELALVSPTSPSKLSPEGFKLPRRVRLRASFREEITQKRNAVLEIEES